MPIIPDRPPQVHLEGAPLPGLCPFLRHPFPECYCLNISGAKIPRILEYCDGNFTSCQVYGNRVRRGGAPQAGGGETPERE